MNADYWAYLYATTPIMIHIMLLFERRVGVTCDCKGRERVPQVDTRPYYYLLEHSSQQ